MKKAMLVAAMALGVTLVNQAVAEANGLNGMLLGAGSGALIGQAAGRNTQSTLVGTAVGAMIGYALDNGVERPRYGYQPRTIVVRPENQQTCQEMEMLATIDGRPEKVYGLACWQDGEWVRIEDERPLPVVYQPVIIHEEYRYGGRGHYRHGRHWARDRRWEDHDRDDHGPSRVIYRAER